MRNKPIIFFTSILLVACWNNKNNTQEQQSEPEEKTVSTDTIQFKRCNYNIKRNIYESKYPCYEIHVDVQYADGNQRVSETINKQLVTFLFGNSIMPFDKAKEHFIDSLSMDFEKDLKEFYDPDNEHEDTYAYEYKIVGKASDNSPIGIIAYTNRIETYTGGAHGGALESYINFRKDTGSIITCQDVFGNKQDEVICMIKDQIVKDNDCKSAEELEEKRGIFSLGDVYLSDNNFLLQKDGILFCYNPYDIAPWSEGFTFTKLTYKQLEGYVNQEIFSTNK